MQIEWREPPPSARGRTYNDTVKFVEVLKTRPGTWALYGNFAANNTSNYRRTFPGTEWVFQKLDDGRFDVYARWVGVS